MRPASLCKAGCRHGMRLLPLLLLLLPAWLI
jgi:hypothetical protein